MSLYIKGSRHPAILAVWFTLVSQNHTWHEKTKAGHSILTWSHNWIEGNDLSLLDLLFNTLFNIAQDVVVLCHKGTLLIYIPFVLQDSQLLFSKMFFWLGSPQSMLLYDFFICLFDFLEHHKVSDSPFLQPVRVSDLQLQQYIDCSSPVCCEKWTYTITKVVSKDTKWYWLQYLFQRDVSNNQPSDRSLYQNNHSSFLAFQESFHPLIVYLAYHVALNWL